MSTSASTPTLSKDPKRVYIPKIKPFFWLAVYLLAGILMAKAIKLPWWVWLIGGVISLLAFGLGKILRPHRNSDLLVVPTSVLIFFFFLGGLRYQLSQPKIGPTHSSYYNDRGLVEVVGLVADFPQVYDSHTNLVVQVESLSLFSSDSPLVEPNEVHGKLLLQVLPGDYYHYGDRLSIRGKLQTPSDTGDFSYEDYLANQKIYSTISYAQVKLVDSANLNPFLSIIYRLREISLNRVEQIMPAPESELLSGILLGDDKGLSSELKQAYRFTGTAHIIAISGYNVALLAGLVITYAKRRAGSWRSFWIATSVLFLYSILVGAQPSVVRAVVMGSFALLGEQIGRRGNGLNSLGLTAFVMCLLNPFLPFDIGFQLSFFATLGLVIFAKPSQARLMEFFEKYLHQNTAAKAAAFISEYLIFTLIAQVLVLPLIIYHFKEVSWLFLIANPLILPVQPLVMVLGGLALLGGLVYIPMGKVLGWFAWPFAAYTNRIVMWLSELAPVSISMTRIHIFWVALYYLVFFTITLSGNKKTFLRKVCKPNTLLLVLGCVGVIIWSAALNVPDKKLDIRIFHDGDNPVVLIESRNGRFVLINGDIRLSTLKENLGRTLPILNPQLDALIIPSCSRDSVRGLLGLETRVKIKQVLWACDHTRLKTTAQLYQAFLDAKIPQVNISKGNWLDLGDDTRLTLHDAYEEAALFNLVDQNFSAVIGYGAWQEISPRTLSKPSLLLVPSNSKWEDTASWLDKQTVVAVTVGQENSNDQDLMMNHIQNEFILRTDQFGWLHIKSDGEQMWIYSARIP